MLIVAGLAQAAADGSVHRLRRHKPVGCSGGLRPLALREQAHLVENAFCRLKDFRRGATRYDKLAANFLSGAALATAIAF